MCFILTFLGHGPMLPRTLRNTLSDSQGGTMGQGCRRWAALVALLGPLLVGVPGASEAITLTVMIGDDDAFAGAQASCGSDCDPGDLYVAGPHDNLFDLTPSVVPYVNQTDVETQAPWEPYTLQYTFAWDTTGLASVSGATVTVQTGSVARRQAGEPGTGFGPADVSAAVGGPPVGAGRLPHHIHGFDR